MTFNMPSAEEMAEQNAGVPLQEDDYIAEVKSYIVDKDNISPFTGEKRDQYKFKFAILSFADGTEVIDVDGNPVADKELTTFIDPTKIGMTPQIAKARKFFTSAFGLSYSSKVSMKGPDDLLGKRLIVGVVNKPDKKNPSVLYSRIVDFRPIRTRVRAETSPVTAEDVAQATGGDVVEVNF